MTAVFLEKLIFNWAQVVSAFVSNFRCYSAHLPGSVRSLSWCASKKQELKELPDSIPCAS